jgi:threonine dehydrogenase-like Zn-dependent dehydrogenase
MRAAVVEGPDRLVVRDIPEPQVGQYDALCEILYGAMCSGTDTHIVACNFPYLSPLPTVLGHESIARVVKTGPKVRHLREGDLVTRVGTVATGPYSVTWGGFAELGIATDARAAEADGLPPRQWARGRPQRVLPPGTDPAAATMIITWRETLSYATRIGIAAGRRVLVIGSGGNGLAYVAHAANAAARQVVMIGSPLRETAARKAGATDYVSYQAQDAVQIVRGICPDGFDIVIDAVGKVGLADLGLSLLRPGGTIGIYGIDDFGRLRLNPDSARGTFTFYRGGYDEPETHEQVVGLFQAGRLDASIWLDLDHPFELEDIPEAVEATRRREVIKALVRIRA